MWSLEYFDFMRNPLTGYTSDWKLPISSEIASSFKRAGGGNRWLDVNTLPGVNIKHINTLPGVNIKQQFGKRPFIHPWTHLLLLYYDVGDSHERKHHGTSEGVSLVSVSLTSKSRLVSASQCNCESSKRTRGQCNLWKVCQARSVRVSLTSKSGNLTLTMYWSHFSIHWRVESRLGEKAVLANCIAHQPFDRTTSRSIQLFDHTSRSIQPCCLLLPPNFILLRIHWTFSCLLNKLIGFSSRLRIVKSQGKIIDFWGVSAPPGQTLMYWRIGSRWGCRARSRATSSRPPTRSPLLSPALPHVHRLLGWPTLVSPIVLAILLYKKMRIWGSLHLLFFVALVRTYWSEAAWQQTGSMEHEENRRKAKGQK